MTSVTPTMRSISGSIHDGRNSEARMASRPSAVTIVPRPCERGGDVVALVGQEHAGLIGEPLFVRPCGRGGCAGDVGDGGDVIPVDAVAQAKREGAAEHPEGASD